MVLTIPQRYNDDHRVLILRGPAAVAAEAGSEQFSEHPKSVVFDELHKYRRWKLFLKGFFDTYEKQTRILVTGSSKLDIFRLGGDSLMGRYFLFRMHPFSAGELVRTDPPKSPIRPPLARAAPKPTFARRGP